MSGGPGPGNGPTQTPTVRHAPLTFQPAGFLPRRGHGGRGPGGRRIASGRHDGYRIESLDYLVEPGERVPAVLLIPDGVDAANPAPAVAVWHQHNGEWHLGKSEPAGLAGNPMHHTGVALAREGYVVLCPDAVCFEERRSPFLEAGNFERFEFLRHVVAGRCLAWKNILDMRRAIDFLVSRPEVAAGRIGCYGHSMGSTHTWLVGPWDERLKCLVGNCCLPTYAAIERTHLLHCFPNFVPGIRAFSDTPEIAALCAPRPLLLNFGELDAGSPLAEVRAGVETIARAYREAGRPEDSPANGTSARVSPADERLVSRVFRVFVSQPQKTLPRMSGYLLQSGIFLPSARRLSEFGRLAALV